LDLKSGDFSITIDRRKIIEVYRIIAVVVVFSFFSLSSFADDKMDVRDLPDLRNVIISGPYCGVYSLAVCLDTFGRDYSLQDLLHPDYIGSFRGSSSSELIKAAKRYGIYGRCYVNVRWQQLKEVKEPMILHFRSNGNSKFDHWVAFLGMEGNHVRILDVPHGIAHLTVAELLAQWDGTAIQLSQNPIRNEPVNQSITDYIFVVLFVVGICSLYKRFFRINNEIHVSTFSISILRYWRKLLLNCALLLGVCVFIAVTYHVLSPIGFLKNPSAVAEVTRRYYVVGVPEISLNEMLVISTRDAIIYDTRYYRDFERGAITGAMNLPINSDIAERRWILQGVDKTQKIVLYCQSSGCGFSDEMVSFLKFNGYHNLSIYRGGYREWMDYHKKQ
jgi:rhodanese-related sulfurtransferase